MRARLALRRDAAAVAETLSLAFAEDPVMRWLAGHHDSELSRATMRSALFAPAAGAALRTGQGYLLAAPGTNGLDVQGVALWNPPDRGFFNAADGEAINAGLTELAAPGGVQRVRALSAALHEASFPEPTYFHLQFIGVAPAQRGRGLGPLLMEPVLQRCDLDGLPAALESSNPRNVTFYRRHGFEAVWEVAPDGGPPLQGMWRPARPRSPAGKPPN